MEALFDRSALAYDQTFTESAIGKLQRQKVYACLEKQLAELKPKSVLEINCGTGADAIWMANQGMDVLATDISAQMIEMARKKVQGDNPRFEQLDLREISLTLAGRKFDLVFSDFGGINCLSPDELHQFLDDVGEVLHPEGELTMVIMPRHTRWERLYFGLKLRLREASRRKRGFAMAHVDGRYIQTWYYNPDDIIKLAKGNFICEAVHPIGLWVPPSYLEAFFRKRPKLLNQLDRLDKRAIKNEENAPFADHYYIRLRRK